MDVINNSEKDSLSPQKEQHSLGPQGEGMEPHSSCGEGMHIEKFEEGLDKTPNSTGKIKKESTLSNLKNLVRGRSKVRNNNEVRDESPDHEKKDKSQNDSRIGKMFQNVSSSMNLRRVWGSSSATKVASGEGEKPEGTEAQSKLGRMLFRRKSLSKTDLDSEEQQTSEAPKFKNLGTLFRKRCTSKTDVMTSESVTSELKSLTLGRRISSTFRGAFSKPERSQAHVQEAP